MSIKAGRGNWFLRRGHGPSETRNGSGTIRAVLFFPGSGKENKCGKHHWQFRRLSRHWLRCRLRLWRRIIRSACGGAMKRGLELATIKTMRSAKRRRQGLMHTAIAIRGWHMVPTSARCAMRPDPAFQEIPIRATAFRGIPMQAADHTGPIRQPTGRMPAMKSPAAADRDLPVIIPSGCASFLRMARVFR